MMTDTETEIEIEIEFKTFVDALVAKHPPECADCCYARAKRGQGGSVTLLECRYAPHAAGAVWPTVNPDDWCGQWIAITGDDGTLTGRTRE